MKTDTFKYTLPQERIAQHPVTPRDASKLMVLGREDGPITHKQFSDLLDYIKAGDILVVNDSRVLPARLYGHKETGGKVEILLLKRLGEARWKALVGGKKVREGTAVTLDDWYGKKSEYVGTITAVLDGAQREITFNKPISLELEELGHAPLPPYIHETLEDEERYQTLYARPTGSAAAPTAGLHFSGDLLFALREKGVIIEMVTLHIGLDTFKPVEADEVSDHKIHREYSKISTETAQRINNAKLAGGRLIAVGTTAVRTLETGALRSAGIQGTLQNISHRDAIGETSGYCPWKPVSAIEEETDLFIYPGYKFRAVDAMITNFHLPQSSLLMLVSAFAGQENVMRAYETAVGDEYRFFSFGDAMLIQ